MINRPFFQVALPLMITILIAAFTAAWSSNKRIDEMSRRLDDTNRRIDETNRRFDRLESTLQDVMKSLMSIDLMSIDHRLTVLEERSSLVRG
jgi:uncharacterized coiled-coil DUF342 family protein